MGRFCLFLPELGFEGTDPHAGDIGHWLGMTEGGGDGGVRPPCGKALFALTGGENVGTMGQK